MIFVFDSWNLVRYGRTLATAFTHATRSSVRTSLVPPFVRTQQIQTPSETLPAEGSPCIGSSICGSKYLDCSSPEASSRSLSGCHNSYSGGLAGGGMTTIAQEAASI